MNFSILTVLVVVESIILLVIALIYFIRKNSSLKLSIEELLARLAEGLFSKLINEEIDKTVERIKEIAPVEDDLDLDLADDSEKMSKTLKKTLSFRSSYLHAEINAHEASVGDQEMFWHYLSDNIAQLLPDDIEETDTETPEAGENEFIDEIMQDLQNKLNNATESNIMLQALLDSLATSGVLEPEQLQLIKNSQADFHDLSQHVSDLDNKIKNSLNLEITHKSVEDSGDTLIIEKTSNKINLEVNKLKDIIFEQGNKINSMIAEKKHQTGSDADEVIQEMLSELERSQKETAMCLDIMETENQRLMEEIEAFENSSSSAENLELKNRITELEFMLQEKEEAYDKLNKEFDSVESEYLAAYKKGTEKD